MSENEVTAEIHGLAYGGECIGTVREGREGISGKKVFLADVIPGETIKAEIIKEEKNLLKGKLLNVITPAESRVIPPCKIFHECGGCELQHINIEAQRKFKLEMVLSMLSKHAGITCENYEFKGMDLDAYHYRNRISLHLNSASELGFYKKNSVDVVDADYCHISSELINQALSKVREYKTQLAKKYSTVVLEEFSGEVYLVLKLHEEFSSAKVNELPDKLRSDFPKLKILHKNKLVATTLSDSYPAGHFSQVNEKGNQLLIDIVTKHISAKEVTDLYAGHGNFTLPLSRLGKNVDLVEMDLGLVKYAKEQAAATGLAKQITFFDTSCEKFFKKHLAREAVVLDPPRSGAKSIVHYFHKGETKEMVYISCNLPSFCRDMKELVKLGYSLEKLYLVDMFPQTHHIELAAVIKAH